MSNFLSAFLPTLALLIKLNIYYLSFSAIGIISLLFGLYWLSRVFIKRIVVQGGSKSINTIDKRNLVSRLGLFFVGVVGSVLAVTIFVFSGIQPAGSELFWQLREIALVLALLSLPTIALNVGILLPIGRRLKAICLLGCAICVITVGWFTLVYPFEWSASGNDVVVLSTYAVGLVFLTVPVVASLVKQYQLDVQDHENRRRLYIAVGMFTSAVIIAVIGFGLFLATSSQSPGSALFWQLREYAILLVMLALPAAVASITIVLIEERRPMAAALIGGGICVVAAGWFAIVYPYEWSAVGNDVPVVSTYVAGMALLTATIGWELVDKGHRDPLFSPIKEQSDTDLEIEQVDDELPPGPIRISSRQEALIATVILLGTVLALVYLLPTDIVILGGVIVALAVGIYVIAYLTATYQRALPDWIQKIPIWLMLLVPVGTAILLIHFYNVTFSLANAILLTALLLLICVYWLVIPTALSQHFKQRTAVASIDEWPEITVLIPAYNEEGYIGPCIDSVLTADYPYSKLNIIVIDDGSSDSTFIEAQEHADARVTVLQKSNGGKHSALNYGLQNVDSEYIIAIDGDSHIDNNAIKSLVEVYEEHSNACAVAGNIKVRNRDRLITRIQALEYIVSINMFRRALDKVGLVKVVPGCLGLFEREIVERVGGFSGDTVTEDFDLTMELQKAGGSVHYSNASISYTEAPNTLIDLYKQRLRWFRGSVQTLYKHREIFVDSRYGLLHRILVPYLFLSVAAVPILGFAVLGSIMWVLLFGSVIQLLGVFVLFVLLETLFATLAVSMEADVTGEDFLLIRYAPFTVLGYKQFHDAIMLKSIFDVFVRPDINWTRARRVRQKERDKSD